MIYKLLIAVILLGIITLTANAQDDFKTDRERLIEELGKRHEKQEKNIEVRIEGKNKYLCLDNLLFDVSLMNTAKETLGHIIFNQFLQMEPELSIEGKSLTYLKEVDIPLDVRVFDYGGRAKAKFLQAYESRKERTINIKDWFGNLKVGKYTLTLGYRFWDYGKLIKSNTVSFEVVENQETPKTISVFF